MGGNFEIVKKLITQNAVKPSNFRFFPGISLGQKQLFNEIKHKSWFVEKGKYDYVFKNSPKNLWKKFLKKWEEIMK